MPRTHTTVLTHQSLVDIPEAELVTRLLSDAHWRSRIIGLHGIPSDVLVLPSVPLVDFPGGPTGDIDLLLVPPALPSESIAAQVKRVKVHDDTFRTEAPNKLREIAKGARQANLLAQLGFSQVYYFVFVVVDSRIRNEGRISYEGLTPGLTAKLDAAITVQGLDPGVGLVHFEFVQPMDDEPLGAGTYGGKLKRLAAPATLPTHVTEWVIEVVKRHA